MVTSPRLRGYNPEDRQTGVLMGLATVERLTNGFHTLYNAMFPNDPEKTAIAAKYLEQISQRPGLVAVVKFPSHSGTQIPLDKPLPLRRGFEIQNLPPDFQQLPGSLPYMFDDQGYRIIVSPVYAHNGTSRRSGGPNYEPSFSLHICGRNFTAGGVVLSATEDGLKLAENSPEPGRAPVMATVVCQT